MVSLIVASVLCVIALKKPIPRPFLVLPETLIAFNVLTSLGRSEISSFSSNNTSPIGALPMRLEKNRFPFSKRSTPSLKNCLCSPNVCSKGPKFNVKLSKAAWLKSGINVASSVKFSVNPYLTSNPTVISLSVLPSKDFTKPETKGYKLNLIGGSIFLIPVNSP